MGCSSGDSIKPRLRVGMVTTLRVSRGLKSTQSMLLIRILTTAQSARSTDPSSFSKTAISKICRNRQPDPWRWYRPPRSGAGEYGSKAVVQVFEGTSGIDNRGCTASLPEMFSRCPSLKRCSDVPSTGREKPSMAHLQFRRGLLRYTRQAYQSVRSHVPQRDDSDRNFSY